MKSIGTLFLLLAFPIGLLANARATADESRIDAGLDDVDKSYPVFVRMTDQLIRGAGDYEKFCAAHQKDRRSQLRQFVLKTLREKSDSSWQKVAREVEQLTRDGQVKNVERFWIVNGFACEATGKACRQLTKSEAVAFVYMQRGPITQQAKAAAGGLPAEQQQQVYEQVLKDWKDNSDEAFSAEVWRFPGTGSASRPTRCGSRRRSPARAWSSRCATPA